MEFENVENKSRLDASLGRKEALTLKGFMFVINIAMNCRTYGSGRPADAAHVALHRNNRIPYITDPLPNKSVQIQRLKPLSSA